MKKKFRFLFHSRQNGNLSKQKIETRKKAISFSSIILKMKSGFVFSIHFEIEFNKMSKNEI